ncbi:MAG: 2-oxo acid dehydrogenase subunit E2 [Anaerolineae bacterium]|nr:2-oxo acid dehydrogenase subunit E2 [Anaerolineae bacterium]
MATKVIMPQLGESVVEGTVMKWLVKEGDDVEELQPILEVNTDKVNTEIPSPAGGKILKIVVAENATVKAGTVLAWIGEAGERLPDSEMPPRGLAAEKPQEAVSGQPRALTQEREGDVGFVSPVVARMAQEYAIDLHLVKGTGERGRITKKDVLKYLAALEKERGAAAEPAAWETPGEGDLFRPTEMVFRTQPAPPPQSEAQQQPLAAASAGGDTLVPLSIVRKRIAEHMVNSVRTSPHVTTVMEADLKRVVAHREANKPDFSAEGVHLTFTAYFACAVSQALKDFRMVNSSWSEQGIVLHRAVNLGIAVALGEEGLIVPVIKNSDSLSLLGMARAINDLAHRARQHQLQPDDVKGGTFSITNHGMSGSLFATPIINQPQCAILGVGAIKKRVIVTEDDALAIRPMVYLSLTFDHRILDGEVADGFLARVVEILEHWH